MQFNDIAPSSNPFAMLVDLDQVVRKMERSERLSRLRSRVYRPLDKPLIALKPGAGATDEFDALVDAAPDEDLVDDMSEDEQVGDGALS